MRIARSAAMVCLVVGFATRAAAQTSCAVADDLCTGDPCQTANLTVLDPCEVDFGNRTLIIGGALTVPSGGTLHFTASSIIVQGRIEAPGGSVTLDADMGAADLRTEIDVGDGGIIAVSATTDIDVKTRLKARNGGSVTLLAGGTLETAGTAVIEVQDNGSLTLIGAAGVTISGKMFAGGPLGSLVQIGSAAGVVTLNQNVSVDGPGQSVVSIDGANGVVVNGTIAATKGAPPSIVGLTSSAGDVSVAGKVGVGGDNGGSIVVQAPMGTVNRLDVDAKGKFDGGSIAVTAATIALEGNLVAKGGSGNGGSVQLTATTALSLVGADVDVTGKVNGGQIGVLGDPASGNVLLDHLSLKAPGKFGNGGTIVLSAPAGSVNVTAVKATATSKAAGTPGGIFVDGVTLTVGPKATFDVDGDDLGGGQIRFEQTGGGLFTLAATCEARDGGTIEALAPAGSLTATGKYRVGTPGCIGLSATTLNVAGASADVPVTPSCP